MSRLPSERIDEKVAVLPQHCRAIGRPVLQKGDAHTFATTPPQD